MSETWLKNNPHLLNYVTIPEYSNIFRNRDDIRGGGVGVYLRDAIDFKRRTDIENIEPELEQFGWRSPDATDTACCFSVLCIALNVCKIFKLG